MHSIKLLPLIFVILCLSCGTEKKEASEEKMTSTSFMAGKATILLPSNFKKDDYHLADGNPNNVRYKSPKNDKSVTLQHLPKIFKDIGVGTSIMMQEANSKGSKVLRREIIEINGRSYAVQESELNIDQNPTYKIDAMTILDDTILSVNISCYQKDKADWASTANAILNSIKIGS